MATRQLYTPFGLHARAQNDSYSNGDSNIYIVVDNGATPSATTLWDYYLPVPNPATNAAFSFDIDATGRWWICWGNGDGTITRNYSDDCGYSWTAYSV